MIKKILTNSRTLTLKNVFPDDNEIKLEITS